MLGITIHIFDCQIIFYKLYLFSAFEGLTSQGNY